MIEWEPTLFQIGKPFPGDIGDPRIERSRMELISRTPMIISNSTVGSSVD